MSNKQHSCQINRNINNINIIISDYYQNNYCFPSNNDNYKLEVKVKNEFHLIKMPYLYLKYCLLPLQRLMPVRVGSVGRKNILFCKIIFFSIFQCKLFIYSLYLGLHISNPRNCCLFVLNLYMLLLLDPETNKIKYCFENRNKMFWVTDISAGWLLEGQQKIFHFRLNKNQLKYHRRLGLSVNKKITLF